MPFCDFRYRSSVLEKHTAANVLLPSQDVPGPYHVMFLLHGLSDDYSIWMRRTSIERYLDGLPIIVVMPDGGRSFYVDAAEGCAYGTAIGIELPEIVRHYFPTKPDWCITGLSMGGYGALRLALGHPDLFVSAVSHSGATGFGHLVKEYSDHPASAEFARILGPDSIGGPNDLYSLTKNVMKDKRPQLRIDCGAEDFLIEDNRAFHKHLEAIGYDHEYAEFPGAHTWEYWDLHVQEAIAFHVKSLGL